MLALENKEEPLYRRAYSYIEDHYMEADLNRDRIAAALGCSTRSLSRAFEGTITIPQIIRRLRLQKARELLHKRSHLTIRQIAEKLHFCDVKYFARCFKELFGLSPSEERQKNVRRKGNLHLF